MTMLCQRYQYLLFEKHVGHNLISADSRLYFCAEGLHFSAFHFQSICLVSDFIFDYLVGDYIINVEIIDDGWMEGTVQRTGQRGMLPSNYVDKV